jgi:chaperonin GroEL
MARAVKTTLGPRGRLAVVDRGWGSPNITKDGAAVADEVELKNPFENLGAKMVKEAASKTGDDAGDGTTTSVVLAEAIYRDGMRQVAAGADPMALKRGIDRAVEALLEELARQSKPVEGRKSREEIAVVAAAGDREIGKLVADALDQVGPDGVVTIEEGKSIETEVKVVEGMQFDRGFLSPHFVTDAERVECVLENPYILIHEEKIAGTAKLVPLLEKAAAAKAPLLVIAEEVEGDALALLVVNKLRGILACAAVKAPAYGDRRKAMLEDIAILTGGEVLLKDIGFDLEKVGLEQLGRAKKVIVDADNTTVVEGAGDRKRIEDRIAQLKREIGETTSDYDREKLEERLAKLSGGVGQIRVGGATETQMKERKARIDDALHATRAAAAEGTVAGGGIALLRGRAVLDALKLEGDAATGAEIVHRACVTPLRQIAENAGIDGGLALRRILAAAGDVGYDAERDAYGDLREAGVIDATKVTRTALKNAASVAGLLLTTECLVCDLPAESAAEAGGHPHPH